MSSPPDEGPEKEEVEDSASQMGRETELMSLAPRLISLEVWCRQKGLDGIAEHLGKAVDLLDRELTSAKG
ncbi:hypothetical protein [Parvularcula marina]|uniref:hypothetical protein n=1 Tax=Parvularcula marina TaxID=2292771 RepID=UPI0035173D68